MKAIDAVENLRELADLLEKHPEADVSSVYLHLYFYDKESFFSIARDFMRPCVKKYEDGDHGYLTLTHGKSDHGGETNLKILRSTACTLVEPAKPAVYDCDLILSADEEAQLAEGE